MLSHRPPLLLSQYSWPSEFLLHLRAPFRPLHSKAVLISKAPPLLSPAEIFQEHLKPRSIFEYTRNFNERNSLILEELRE